MGRHIEPLDGGLNTSMDPAQLSKGQMTEMRNFVYKNGSTSLVRADGRTPFGTVTASAVDIVGLVDMNFDNGDHYLLAHYDDKLRYASVSGAGNSGTFAFTNDYLYARNGFPITIRAAQASAKVATGHGLTVGMYVESDLFPTGTTISATATTAIGFSSANNVDVSRTAFAVDKIVYVGIITTGTIETGTGLSAVQYRNKYFLFNGSGSKNYVGYLRGTTAETNQVPMVRDMGLNAVSTAPVITTAAGNLFNYVDTATGYYEYWTTEVYKYTRDGVDQQLESTFSSDIGTTTVYVTSKGQYPIIQRPGITNGTASHWRVYRSPKKTYRTDKMFPNGFLVAEMPITTTSHSDTETSTNNSTKYPTYAGNNSGTRPTDFFLEDTTSVPPTVVKYTWDSADSALVSGGAWASAVLSAGTFDFNDSEKGTPGANIYALQPFSDFGFDQIEGNVRGVVCEIKAYLSAGSNPVTPTVFLCNNRYRKTIAGRFGAGAQKTGNKISATTSGGAQTITLGSSTDSWRSSTNDPFPGDFFNSDFYAVIMLAGDKSNAIGIDYVKVTLYYGAPVDSSVVQFPTVVMSFGDITSQVGKRFPPPAASMGTVFQDSLVVNDLSNKSVVRWSFPEEPESFPPIYFYDFETDANDEVTCVATVNNRLVVGLTNSMFRMNYLPSERDASYDKGKAVETISSSFGVVNSKCSCRFTIDGRTEQLAFISKKGLHYTDGFSFHTASKSLNWRQFIPAATSGTECIALVNDPENRSLRFYFRNDTFDPDTPNETYFCLHASYDQGDIKADGDLKFSGPVHMRNWNIQYNVFAHPKSVCQVQLDSGDTRFYIGYSSATAAGAGKVYREGSNLSIPSENTNAWFKTRRMYFGGLTGEWELDDVYGYTSDGYGAVQVTYLFENFKTNSSYKASYTKDVTVQYDSFPITADGTKLHRVTPQFMAEGLETTVTFNSPTYRQTVEYLIYGSKDLGREDSGL